MRFTMPTNPLIWLAGGSLIVLAVAIFLLYQDSQRNENPSGQRPLRVYCAAALKPVMTTIAVDYEKETGRHVEFEFGDSGQMLASVSTRPDGDLFLPADDSYVRLAQERGLVAETIPLCRMHAVILVRPSNPRQIARFDDLLKPDLKVGIANPDRAAIGKVVRSHLVGLGKWDHLNRRLEAQFSNVTDAANAVQLGSLDTAIVWDAVAVNYPELAVVHTAELEGAIGRVVLAVLASSPDSLGARQLARYIATSDKGLSQFRKAGFTDVETAPLASPQTSEVKK